VLAKGSGADTMSNLDLASGKPLGVRLLIWLCTLACPCIHSTSCQLVPSVHSYEDMWLLSA